jgi:hypothetical protein
LTIERRHQAVLPSTCVPALVRGRIPIDATVPTACKASGFGCQILIESFPFS